MLNDSVLVALAPILLGLANLEGARRRQFFRPFALFWALTATWLLWEYYADFFTLRGVAPLSAYGLAFCAASPFVGWMWWGRQGVIRRGLLRSVSFLLLTAAGLLVWGLVLGPDVKVLVLAVASALLVLAPWRKCLQRTRQSLRSSSHRRQEKALLQRQKQVARRQERQLARQSKAEQRRERELRKEEERFEALEREIQKEQAALDCRRREVTEQVRILRTQEVERIRSGEAGLRFHPYYGFLMAEAWRVLRAQIARRERIPPAEHEAFFHQVVAELLEPDDFPDRYLHETGRKAIQAASGFLTGVTSLPKVYEAMKRLRLELTQLAPEPLPDYDGRALLEAWLVPHRRYQDRCWEDFQDGRFPQQDEVIRFLRDESHGLPSKTEWRELWDHRPALFVGSLPEPPPSVAASPVPPAATKGRNLWTTVSSIWKNVRAE